MRIAWRGFQPFVDERCPLDMDQIRRALDEVANLGNDLTKDNHDRVIQSQPFKCLNERFEEFVDHLRKTNGPLAAFWMSYIDMVANAAHGKRFNGKEIGRYISLIFVKFFLGALPTMPLITPGTCPCTTVT